MTVTRRHSPLSLWTLCLAVLLGAHLCGLHHGQASGLALSGLQGGYCSVDPAGFAPVPIEQAEPDGEWSCPLCQSPATTDGGWPPALGVRGEPGMMLPGRRSARRRPRRQLLAWPGAP
ncbi:MAG TPA: hypothetical protein VK019_00325 [Pseudomonas sp.]|nr:hypothetical protein [Pseudomonas sp.]